MKIGQSFPSKFIKASDLPEGRFIAVTMDRVESENVAAPGAPAENKPVLYFSGKQKGLVLNKTNAGAISDAYGDETDNWRGRSILLYSTEVLFQGSMVPCVRVKVQRATQAAPPAPVQRQTVPAAVPSSAHAPESEFGDEHFDAEPLDDNIPFAWEGRRSQAI